LIRRRVLVSGRVQGVGFRQHCAAVARGAGVAGWVRNRRDGRVEVVLEGPADRVAQVVSWCRRGPTLAEVEAVEVRDEPPTGESGFRVAATA
jgi:acylphosphatase